jgi:hypothetical protein
MLKSSDLSSGTNYSHSQSCDTITLKGPYHRIRSAWKWYCWLGLVRDFLKNFWSLLIFYWTFEVPKNSEHLPNFFLSAGCYIFTSCFPVTVIVPVSKSSRICSRCKWRVEQLFYHSNAGFVLLFILEFRKFNIMNTIQIQLKLQPSPL